jgi:hypothetical protein
MHRDLLAQSPLLFLPLTAMFVFLAVWIVTSIHTLLRPRSEIEEAARLPLDDGPCAPGRDRETQTGEPR